MTNSELLNKIDKTSKNIMNTAHETMHNDLETSYYVADFDVNKLDKLVTAYGKATHSEFLNHKNFVLDRISNGIVDMHKFNKKLHNKLDHDKQTGNVDEAIKITHYLDNISNFDYALKYGDDEVPSDNFYNDPSSEVIPQLNIDDVYKDIENATEVYIVSADTMYMFMIDFRKNILSMAIKDSKKVVAKKN